LWLLMRLCMKVLPLLLLLLLGMIVAGVLQL
jgi:hypothetical protein